MRIKTRSGGYINLPDGSVVKQEKKVSRQETYYVLHLSNGRSLSASEPVEGLAVQQEGKKNNDAHRILHPGVPTILQ